ncbi:hypothetical protein ABZ498_28665 [Streptomyces lavendulocolor]|uniref:hypothetical protein n=1 Tax=Streptomyces lavendulocolor TaxID=67316 RepID=UPI0016774F77|nr:hypothetical protein GCM10018771_18570 [Streptomyces cellulosae]
MVTDLVPSPVLADALDRAKWSARELVKAINPRLNAMGQPPVDLTAGYKWLRGHRPRSAAVRDVVAVVLTEATGLRYTSAQLWGLEQPATETAETEDLLGPLPLEHVLRTASEWTSGAVEPALVHSAAAEHLTAAVWDATRQAPAPPAPGRGDGNYVAPEFVDMLFEQLAALRRLDDRTGGGPLSQRQARIALHESLTLIHTGRYNAATGNRLLRYAASAAQLAGWMSFDAGLDPAGHRYQLLAIRIARAAGDTTTVSNALGMLAYQHAAGSNPRLALRFAHAAVEHSARAVPLVQARAWGRLATAQAAAGDLDAFRRATDRCRQLIGQRHSDDPPSLYYFTPQQVDAESGQALVDLAGHTRGRRSLLLQEAAQLLNPTAAQGTATGYRRSGLLHGIHLVRASIGARDTEATAHWITALTTTLPQVQSIRCRTLLTRVRTAAGRQLRAAGHSDALDALRTALSTP